MSRARLAIINTHPIQYYSPLYRRLADRDDLDVHVFYAWRGAIEDAYDPGFERNISWDIPLLGGYEHTFVPNTAPDPGTHHFRGIIAPDLIGAIEAWRPDALLVFSWSYQAHLNVLRHFQGRSPILFRGDSTLLNEVPGPRKWVRRILLRWVYRYVDTALYVGQNNRAYFEAHGFKDEALVWVPHAIDNQRFVETDGVDQEAAQWRHEIGIPDDASVVLFAGKMEPVKAPDVLLEAFINSDTQEAHLVFVGSGPLETELRQGAATYPNVHFLGFQNQSHMPVVYRLGDLFVLPSRTVDTWGLGVNEAMACGRPVVVSSQVGCAPDLVKSDNGAIVRPNDPIALRDTLNTLLNDRERLRSMGRRSAERITKWSTEEAAERTAAAIHDAVLHH